MPRRVFGKLVPRVHAECEIRVRKREDQDRQNQTDRGAWNYGGRALRFLRGLRDRFEPDERDDCERDAVHQREGRWPGDGHRVYEQRRIEGEEKAEEEDQRLAYDVEPAYEFVECARFAHADDVEHREPADDAEYR